MKIKKLKKTIVSLVYRKKKSRRKIGRDMISIQERHIKKFKKRRKKAIGKFFRRFSISLPQKNFLYYVGGFFVFLIIGVISLFAGPFFEVKNIYINRGNMNVDIDLAYRSIESVRGKKIYSLEKKYIQELLLNQQKSLKDITVQFQIPQTINIEITAFETIFKTYIGEKLYDITRNGAIIPSKNNGDTPYLHMYGGKDSLETSLDYKILLDPYYIKSIQWLSQSLKENIIQIQIDSLHYYITERELIISLTDGGDIIFDLTKNLEQQIEKVAIFHNESGDITQKNIIYIDARITNKVFYCDTESEFVCKVNLRNIYGDKKSLPIKLENSKS